MSVSDALLFSLLFLLFNKNHVFDIHFSLASTVGIPRMRWFGPEGEYEVLVMDLLGNNLEELFMDCDYKFSLRTVLMLAGQMVLKCAL